MHHLTTLQESLSDWTDFDGAAYILSLHLGIFNEAEHDFCTTVKWVFWSNNSLGNMLYDMLETMAKEGILEVNEDQQYRWNSSWKIEDIK